MGLYLGNEWGLAPEAGGGGDYDGNPPRPVSHCCLPGENLSRSALSRTLITYSVVHEPARQMAPLDSKLKPAKNCQETT